MKKGRWRLATGNWPERKRQLHALCVPTCATLCRNFASGQLPVASGQAVSPLCQFASLLLGLLCATSATAASHTFVVSGLGGEPEYEQRFQAQAEQIAAVAVELAEQPEHVVKLIGEEVSREVIRRELRALADRAEAQDAVTVVLIGHGTYDGEEYRFNIPGPDITGKELERLLERIRARQQLIVNATSASGATVEKWAKPGRVVITATKSGGERTATRFAAFWAEALKTSDADTDKDEIVTATEAFAYATRQVAATFKADVALATEHARIEGGDVADTFAVSRLGSAAILSFDPEVNALLAQRATLEEDLDRVKARRATLGEETYYDELERVLVRFALLQRQIDSKRASSKAVSP